MRTKFIANKEVISSHKLPGVYDYNKLLSEHLGQPVTNLAFDGNIRYPRQFEIHLGNNSKTPCNLSCNHCVGSNIKKDLIDNASVAIQLIEKLKGNIPYYIFAGVYSEPLLNREFLTVLKAVKRYDNYFGIHTNGTLLFNLEKKQKLITNMTNMASDKGKDYISISIDSCSPESFQKTKNAPTSLYINIIKAIDEFAEIREKTGKIGLKIRLTYLLNEHNSKEEELYSFIERIKGIGPSIDSLRFSIPRDTWGNNIENYQRYMNTYVLPFHNKINPIMQSFTSSTTNERPYIMYMSPEYQDVNLLRFSKCFYGYFQATLAADGFFYRCSAAATSSFPNMRLGRMSSNLSDFIKIIQNNQVKEFNPQKSCFPKDIRCCRMATDINNAAENENSSDFIKP